MAVETGVRENRSISSFCLFQKASIGKVLAKVDTSLKAVIAALVDDLVIRPGGVLRHREWGLYEVGINGPDGLLVRIGWPSELIESL